jgi:hypothetical protein
VETARRPLIATLLAAAVALPALAEPMQPLLSARPGELEWHAKEALPAGAYGAVAHGDPATGEYAFYGLFPERFVVPPHWHSHDVDVLVLEGVMVIERPGQRTVTLPPRAFLRLPAGQAYTAKCLRGCLFLAWGNRPFDIHYVDLADDPRVQRDIR